MPSIIPDCLKPFNKVSLEAGTRLFQSGDSCQQFVYLLQGSIRVDLLALSGKEVMLYRFGEGETCILTTSCLLSGDLYSAQAFAEQDITAIVVPVAQFQKLLNESGEFRQLVFASFAHRLVSMIAKIEEISFLSLDRRLANLLTGMVDNNKSLSVTHEQLAAVLGTAREVVSRKLGSWEKKGWLIRGRGTIELVNPEEINRLACCGEIHEQH